MPAIAKEYFLQSDIPVIDLGYELLFDRPLDLERNGHEVYNGPQSALR
jgi:hypothetical protein